MRLDDEKWVSTRRILCELLTGLELLLQVRKQVRKQARGTAVRWSRYLVDATAGYLNFFKWGSTNPVILERSDLLDPAHRDVIHLYPDPRFKSRMLKKRWVCCYKSVGAAGVGPLRLKDPTKLTRYCHDGAQDLD